MSAPHASLAPVLISPRLVRAETYSEVRDALDLRWGSFLESAGLVPLIVPGGASVEFFFERFEPRGLILSGGNDPFSASGDPLSKRRDERERRMIELAVEAGMPVLGVCRGLQVIAEWQGVRLVQVSGHVGTLHRISVVPESRYLAAFNGVEVNSYHSIGVDGGAEKLRVAARSEDGVIEALEDPSRSVLGVMWHPERYDTPREVDLALFRAFFGTPAPE